MNETSTWCDLDWEICAHIKAFVRIEHNIFNTIAWTGHQPNEGTIGTRKSLEKTISVCCDTFGRTTNCTPQSIEGQRAIIKHKTIAEHQKNKKTLHITLNIQRTCNQNAQSGNSANNRSMPNAIHVRITMPTMHALQSFHASTSHIIDPLCRGKTTIRNRIWPHCRNKRLHFQIVLYELRMQETNMHVLGRIHHMV